GEKVIVEGVNLVYKHVKRGHPKSPQGGRLRMEKPIHSSNVQFFCDKCQKGVKLGLRYLEDGSKERFCRKCKTSAGQVSPPRAAHAKEELELVWEAPSASRRIRSFIDWEFESSWLACWKNIATKSSPS